MLALFRRVNATWKNSTIELPANFFSFVEGVKCFGMDLPHLPMLATRAAQYLHDHCRLAYCLYSRIRIILLCRHGYRSLVYCLCAEVDVEEIDILVFSSCSRV